MHDFNPGIHPYPHGLFWTAPLPTGGNGAVGPDSGVTVHLGAGTARMTAANLGVRDFFNLPNALLRFQRPASVRATVSFDVRWLGPASGRSAVTSPPGSAGQLLTSPVTMTWSAANASGFRFTSRPTGTRSIFGQLGRVRNGTFA